MILQRNELYKLKKVLIILLNRILPSSGSLRQNEVYQNVSVRLADVFQRSVHFIDIQDSHNSFAVQSTQFGSQFGYTVRLANLSMRCALGSAPDVFCTVRFIAVGGTICPFPRFIISRLFLHLKNIQKPISVH